MIVEVQPISVLMGLAVTGLFTGIGVAIGGVIVKVWLEPRITKWQNLHSKISEQIKKPDLSESVLFKKHDLSESVLFGKRTQEVQVPIPEPKILEPEPVKKPRKRKK